MRKTRPFLRSIHTRPFSPAGTVVKVNSFCPFGVFPRSYEVVCPEVEGRITDLPAAVVDTFADLIHQALQILGPLPLDYEIHDGPGVPLHAHVSARYFPYSNVGGTLNLPADLATTLGPPRGR